jgi:Flp pilus assembly protein TadG
MESARNILRDEGGTAVVEFAFLLPIMLMLFIGVVEVTNVLRLDRKVVAAAQATADLVTQRREVSDAQLNDILRAAELILEPFPASALSIGIAGVQFDAEDGDPEVDWTKSWNGGSVPDATTLAEGLGGPGEGVVVVQVTYSYTPMFFDFVMSAADVEETAVLRPRRSSVVEGPTP